MGGSDFGDSISEKQRLPSFIAPFDEEDADLIVRSSDNENFRVHKIILTKASPVFHSKCRTPTGSLQDTGVHTIALEEDHVTVERLLRLCYPFSGPQLDTLDDLSSLLDVCHKYEMHALAERLASAELAKFVDVDPLRAYVLACRVNSIREAERAAFGCLLLPLEEIIASNVPEIERLPASSYRSLLVYYTSCRQVAAKVAAGNYKWIISRTDYCWMGASDCVCQRSTGPDSRIFFGKTNAQSAVQTTQWWSEMMRVVVTYLSHQAAPRDIHWVDATPFPKGIVCLYCKERYIEDLRRFFGFMELEIEQEVKAVSISKFYVLEPRVLDLSCDAGQVCASFLILQVYPGSISNW